MRGAPPERNNNGEHVATGVDAGTVAERVAEHLVQWGVTRVYGLCGGHIQPIWDAIARAGIEIVDVRHEGSAVFMAHADAELTGRVGVALVTAGPGLTNALTAIANVSLARCPVLVISGRPPRPQAGMGAMQELPQPDLVKPLCQRVESVSQSRHAPARLEAVTLAALGDNDGPAGPTYIDFPTDLLDEPTHEAHVPTRPKGSHTVRRLPPAVGDIEEARRLISISHRPLVIAGRPAHTAPETLSAFLDQTGALYVDTPESRGAIPPTHSSHVPAMRARAMREADLIITLGRRLDFQLAYGSPAVFAPTASFLRIGRTFGETSENRRGEVEIRADTGCALSALLHAPAAPESPDQQWLEDLRAESGSRSARLAQKMAEAPVGSDGRMHPYRLLAAVNAHLDQHAIAVADGGDILSFARVGLPNIRYLDCGALGCLGVGVPFATAAAIAQPDRRVIAVIGDGSFGFTAMEVATAVRQRAQALFVIANNEAWNIERQDQQERYAGNIVGTNLDGCRYDLLARGLGAHAERVEHAEELDAAIRRGLENRPAVLDVLVTRDAVSPDFKSGLGAVPPLQALLPWHIAEIEHQQAAVYKSADPGSERGRARG